MSERNHPQRLTAVGEETVEQAPVIRNSRVWQGNNMIHSEVRGPFFNGPHHFAVHFTFDFTPRAAGKRVTLEVGVHTVRDDMITRGQFFYDGER